MKTTFEVTVRKAGQVFTIDESDFPANVIDHIHQYGWKQNLSDAAASAKTEDEALAMVEKRLDAFRNGLVRTFGVTAANVEDVAYAEIVRTFLEGKGPEYTRTALKKAVKTWATAHDAFAEYVATVCERQGKELTEDVIESNWDKLIVPKAKAMIEALESPTDDIEL